MKHIAIDARIMGTGTGKYIEGLLEGLQEIDKTNQYSVLLSSEPYEWWKPKSSNFKKILSPYSMYGLDGQIGLARQLYQLKPDIVHYGFQQTSLIYFGKKIMTLHDLTQLRIKNIKAGSEKVYSAKQTLLNIAMRLSAKTSRSIIVPTNYVKQDLAKEFGINPKKIQVTYQGVALPAASKPEPVDLLDKKPFILYVGTMHTHKNVERLVEAVSEINKDQELYLVAAGKISPFHEKVEQYAKKLGFNNYRFLGFTPDDQLAWLYKNCRAYVVPSLSEGFGLPGLEALANGAPLVSSNSTCLPEVYGDAAEYFNPTDVNDMKKAILRVINDESLRSEMINAGKKQAAKYSWRKTAEQTLEVYKKHLGV